MSNLSSLPDKETLLSKNYPKQVYKVNGHFHTPFSFSAFQTIDEVFEMAQQEDMRILGINDFYVTDGYEDFNSLAFSKKVFPLFNIEFISLIKEFQEQGIRVNDPNNPGRTYFSGKGLMHPVKLSTKNADILASLLKESQKQVMEMTDKLNALLNEVNAGFSITFDEIKSRFAKNLVRERHIAKALRVKIFEFFSTDAERTSCLGKIYGAQSAVQFSDEAAVENEIRSVLLKSGGAAFVPESPEAFPGLDTVIDIITDAGGIPCYPVLLDDKNGNYTDFEGDAQKMYEFLSSKGIGCIELIPGRNTFENLKKFVQFFNAKGFVINFGTEHNSPTMQPLTVTCSGGVELDDELLQVSYEGACVIAAHQYLKAKGEEGFLNAEGEAKNKEREEFISLGNAVIAEFLNM